MYAESFPNSIDLIVLLCSACVFVLVCLSVYRINTIRNVITETRETSAQIRTVEQNELQILTRDTQYQLRRSRDAKSSYLASVASESELCRIGALEC